MRWPRAELTLFGKLICGALSGGGHQFGKSRGVDGGLATRETQAGRADHHRCSLGAINRGYQDLLRGKNGRGVVIHGH